MLNLKETTSTAKKWLRSPRQVIRSEYGQIPSCDFLTEEAIEIDGKVTVSPRQTITKKLDPTKSFSLLNPETGAIIGSMTQQELMVAWYSFTLDNIK